MGRTRRLRGSVPEWWTSQDGLRAACALAEVAAGGAGAGHVQVLPFPAATSWWSPALTRGASPGVAAEPV